MYLYEAIAICVVLMIPNVIVLRRWFRALQETNDRIDGLIDSIDRTIVVCELCNKIMFTTSVYKTEVIGDKTNYYCSKCGGNDAAL